jgi:AraC-like DNA-binding protein
MTPGDHLFHRGLVMHGEQRVRGVVVSCGSCEVTESLRVNNFGGHSSSEEATEIRFVARKLESQGWHFGRTSADHRCPQCFTIAKQNAARNASEKRAREKDEMQQSPHNGINGSASSRPMTRDDRRIIFEKLNEVYVSDKVGYGDGWTDEKVAADLGVPRAWVKLLRDENFGDEMANDDIRARIKEAADILAQIKAHRPVLDNAVGEMRKLQTSADKIEKSLAEIGKVFK